MFSSLWILKNIEYVKDTLDKKLKIQKPIEHKSKRYGLIRQFSKFKNQKPNRLKY